MVSDSSSGNSIQHIATFPSGFPMSLELETPVVMLHQM